MFINRQLRLALLISFFWHVFLMTSVSIVFLPRGLKVKQYSSVAFLGSILRSPVSFAEAPLALREFPLEIDSQRQSFFYGEPQGSLISEKKAFEPDEFIDTDLPLDQGYGAGSYATLAREDSSKQSSKLEREVVFRPPIPKYPEWAGNQEAIGSCVVFKIYISSQGLVQAATNVQGSGNPEIDASLARYVRKWRFAPVVKEAQWQTVKINLDVE